MEPFIGQIMLWAGTYEPVGWAFCDGREMLIEQNPALFSLLGATYGGDGRLTFCLPDLRGRVALGFGEGPGLNRYHLGFKSGSESNILYESQLPRHTHEADLYGTTEDADINDVNNAALASGGRDAEYKVTEPNQRFHKNSVKIGTAGENVPVNNMQPYLALNYVIALDGLYPQRS